MANDKVIDTTEKDTGYNFETKRDNKVESYNSISQFLILKGLSEEDLSECMKLVRNHGYKLIEFYLSYPK